MSYLLILGNAPELAKAEAETRLSQFNVSARTNSLSSEALQIEIEQELPADFFKKLGGTVKAAKIRKIAARVSDIFPENGARVIFGLSFYGEKTADENGLLLKLAGEIKEELGKSGRKARYVLPGRGERQLSSVVVTKQKVRELILVNPGTEKAILGETIWVQDFEDWNKRDYGRPEVEAHIGMLPPKVARMMVNLAISNFKFQILNFTLLDPFCGVGTILAEALMVGCNVIGADMNGKQVDKTKHNLQWLTDSYKLTDKTKVLTGDARKISQKLPAQSIDAIVTEPDLGPTTRMNYELRISGVSSPSSPMNYGKLERLYIDSLIDWKKILKPGGRVVIVLPSFGENSGLVKNVIDKAAAIGYILTAGPFPYFRPQAKVRRNICVFTSDQVLGSSH